VSLQSLKYFVGVDIGGTNTRVALDTGSSDEPYVQVQKKTHSLATLS
jgi:N-acetylglucosamine kinase-like BadF-type ATPase